MRRQIRYILLAFIVCVNLKATLSLPVPEDELDTSTRLLGSSVVTSISVVAGNEKDGKSTFQSRKIVPLHELPASPAGLLRPDKFQFYTLNKDGDVVTKQMTVQEIQSLIAAGGGHLPTEIHETQIAGEVPSAGMKVEDVVQNVQNVLKNELSKPTTVMTSLPTIPGHSNDEWSSILPSILAGDMESQSINIPETEMVTEVKQKVPIPETEDKPDSDSLNIKLQSSEVKPLLETTNTSLKLNISLKAPETSHSNRPPTKEKPVMTDKDPQDPLSSGTHYEPISTYSTSKPSTLPLKQQTKPIRPGSSDLYSNIPSFSSSEKPIFHKPSKPEESKPQQGQKPQISVRPDPGTYEDRPLVSVGPEKLNKPSTTKPSFSKPSISKPSSPSYILLSEKQTPALVKLTTKKPIFETSSKPSYSFRPEYPPVSYSEIPMIPVQVITADQVLISTPQYQKNNTPIFQVLNTISADALNSSKLDSEDELTNLKTAPTNHPVYKPDKIKVPQKTNNSSQEVKTPLPEVVFSETSFYTKMPEFITSSKTETPDMVSVISETHSTSIKIPGHPEIQIPARFSEKPPTTPKPEMKPIISMQTIDKSSEKPLPNYQSSSATKVPVTSALKETTEIFETEATTQFAKESTTENTNPTVIDPVSEVTQVLDTSEISTLKINKESETTTNYVFEASTIPLLETGFQKMPDISPDKQMTSPETSAIEKIIETLHHPTETKFETSTIDLDSAANDFGTEFEFSTTFTILGEETSTADYTTFVTSRTTTGTKSESTEEFTSSTSRIRTSTAPTLLSLENASGEPLPTELADSLSSMISQISETVPSFLSDPQRLSLTEMPLKGAENYKSTTISEEKFSTFSTYEPNTESTKVTQDFPSFETTMYKNVDVDTSATLRLEDATETLKDVEISSSSKPLVETLTSTTRNTDLVSNITSNSSSSSTASPSSASTSTASSSTTHSSTTQSTITQYTTTQFTTTQSTATQSSTIQSSTIPTVSSTTQKAAENLNFTAEEVTNQTIKLAETAQDQLPQSDELQKLSSDNVAGKPIIRVDITDSVSTNIPENDKEKENTESPVIRIQMADAVSVINNLLESAPAQTTTSYVTLNLPEEATNSPNNIASGLVAGFLLGNETVFGSQKTPLTYSNASSSTEATVEVTVSAENKTKETEEQIKITEDKFKESEGKIKDTEAKIKEIEDKTEVTEITKVTEVTELTEVTTEKSEDAEDKAKVTIEESEAAADKSNVTKDKTKDAEVPDKVSKTTEGIANSIQSKKESSTTERELLVPTNADKIEDTIKVEEPQTHSTETGSTTDGVMRDVKDSVTSFLLPEATTEEELTNTSNLSAQVESSINSIEKNQTKASNVSETVVQSEMNVQNENLPTQKENITEMRNVTDLSTHILTSLVTEIKETETSASEKLETIITTTSEANKETVITLEPTQKTLTTPKPTEQTIVTTPKSKITTSEPSKVPQSGNKTRKPETPVVRIDLSPETNPPELPEKIQLTELPIFEKVSIINPETPVVVNSNVPANGDVSSDKKPSSESNIDEEKKTELGETILTNVDQSQKNASVAEGQEVRIRVNDTAVLVSKLPSINVNQTKVSLDKEDAVIKNSLVLPQSVKEEIKKTDEKIQFILLEPLKNSSYDSPKEDEKKPDVNSFEQEAKPSNDTKMIANTQILESEKNLEDAPIGFKPVNTIPVSNPLAEKESIDQTKENAYNKLGEIPGSISLTENSKNKPSNLFQKKNATTPTFTKPGPQGSSGHKPHPKPTSVARPSGTKLPADSTGSKPSSGPNSLKPNLSTKHRPSIHETISQKPTKLIKKPDGSLNTEEKWALIPQTNVASAVKNPRPTASTNNVGIKESPRPQAQQPQVALDASQSAIGLDGSIANLTPDVVYFSNLCNELAFSFWSAANKGLSTSRSLALSPFGMTSMLAMVFLGARGPTSDEMNDMLKLDDVSTFNPHLVFQNVTDTVSLARRQGIANAAFVRELFADRSKVGKIMPFYKEQAQQFYEGFVDEVNFAAISDIVRRRTNLLIRKQTGGRIRDFVRTNTVPLRPPLAALSANVFQTECNSSAASSEGRDGELYFAVSPAVRQRKLIPVPATVWKSGVLAGYEPSLDATVIALGGMEKLVSTIFVVPGQQGHMAPGDNLDNLETRLVRGALHDGGWEKLLKVLIPRTSLELQVPKFSHRSIVNATAALKRMGLAELFTKHANLKGINGVGHDLYLADVLQMNLFSTCGDENISSGRHHVEIYPGPPSRNFREMADYDDNLGALANGEYYPESEDQFSSLSSVVDDSTSQESIGRSSRQAEISEKPRLKLDRPFLYYVRHNPTGLILHMGRFNPRLLP